MAWTSDDLVSAVRLRSRLPSATDISATEILGIADDEMSTTLADVVRNVDPSFWLATHTATVVSGTAAYALPVRAIGAGIERVELEDSSGNRQPVVALNEHDIWRWSNGARDPMWTSHFAYVIEADELLLLPTPTSADAGLTLRVRYQRQPSRLVAVSSAAAISGATTTTLVVTDPPPSAMSTAGSLLDVIRGTGSNEPIATDVVVSSYSGGTITLTAAMTAAQVAAISTSTASGARTDYVCVAGETVYPAVPTTLWPVLVRATVRTLLDELGDERGTARAQGILEQHIVAARSVVTPRTRQIPTFVNHGSYLRRGRR